MPELRIYDFGGQESLVTDQNLFSICNFIADSRFDIIVFLLCVVWIAFVLLVVAMRVCACHQFVESRYGQLELLALSSNSNSRDSIRFVFVSFDQLLDDI